MGTRIQTLDDYGNRNPYNRPPPLDPNYESHAPEYIMSPQMAYMYPSQPKIKNTYISYNMNPLSSKHQKPSYPSDLTRHPLEAQAHMHPHSNPPPQSHTQSQAHLNSQALLRAKPPHKQTRTLQSHNPQIDIPLYSHHQPPYMGQYNAQEMQHQVNPYPIYSQSPKYYQSQANIQKQQNMLQNRLNQVCEYNGFFFNLFSFIVYS